MNSKQVFPEELLKKPLIEAIFEFRWELQQKEHRELYPNFTILVGRFYDRIKEWYPLKEDLPICQFADALTPFSVRHRFRPKADGWPLTQIGPGILSINDTKNYRWKDFSKEIQSIVDQIYEAYPDKIKPKELSLRYMNAIPLTHDINTFIKNNFNIKIEFVDSIFKNTAIKSEPHNFKLELGFSGSKENFQLIHQFNSGFLEGKKILVWDIIIKSLNFQKAREEIGQWLEEAHLTAKTWFFLLCKENLITSFQPKE